MFSFKLFKTFELVKSFLTCWGVAMGAAFAENSDRDNAKATPLPHDAGKGFGHITILICPPPPPVGGWSGESQNTLNARPPTHPPTQMHGEWSGGDPLSGAGTPCVTGDSSKHPPPLRGLRTGGMEGDEETG